MAIYKTWGELPLDIKEELESAIGDGPFKDEDQMIDLIGGYVLVDEDDYPTEFEPEVSGETEKYTWSFYIENDAGGPAVFKTKN